MAGAICDFGNGLATGSDARLLVWVITHSGVRHRHYQALFGQPGIYAKASTHAALKGMGLMQGPVKATGLVKKLQRFWVAYGPQKGQKGAQKGAKSAPLLHLTNQACKCLKSGLVDIKLITGRYRAM